MCMKAITCWSPIVRKPSLQQGRALEMLGHAIEYLVDSYTAANSDVRKDIYYKAIEMLSELSLSIFYECKEVVSFRQRLSSLGRHGLGVGTRR